MTAAFFLPIPKLVALANALAPPVIELLTAPSKIGLVVIAIILIPVMFLITASFWGTPRTFRIPVLFLSVIIAIASGIIFSFALWGAILRFIVPQ